jgi:sugar lactone lactonase YvrE
MAVGTALNYQWYFNSNSMSAATNAIFTLINAQTNNAGSYYAVVSNPAGSVTSSNAVLTVLPFLITTQPTNQTVVRGGTAIFGVVVSGTGPFTYQWQLNGTNLQNGIITTVAGNGIRDYSGDGGAAVNASLNNPNGVCVDSSGNLFIADYWNNRIRKVDAEGVITTVAGNGNPGYSGDGVAATSATLYCPNGVALDTADNLFIADYYNNRVRKVDTNSVIITVAGNGTVGYSGDGGAATNASLFWPSAVFVDGSCRLFIVDSENNVIRKVSADGIISTVAGNGTSGYSGDEGVATNANLNSPCSVIVDAFKNMIIADAVNNRVRKVNTNGIITTIAGSGTRGYSGDGGAATNACLSIPTGVTLDPVGNLLIADYWNFVVRKVDVNGLITTVAGNGTNGYSGDGGPGTNACLFLPRNVAVDASGNCFIADMANNVVRRVGSTTCSALTLNNVTTNNAGVYTVVVTGHNGSVISSNAILTVISPPCAPAPSGLVSWWQAEGNANDSVGTNNGIATNITYTNGEVGQAFVFAGTSSNGAGSYVRIPANPSLDVGAGNGLTFETWINPANLKLQSVFQWGNTSGRIGSSLTISGQGPGGNIFLNLTDTNGEGHALITGGGVVTTNKYQHLAMTYDKTSGMAVLYLNGAVVQSGNLGVFTPQTSFDLYLGIQPFSLGFGRYYFNGVMDEPSLYNRALSAAEIQAVYMAGSAGKCPLLPTPP